MVSLFVGKVGSPDKYAFWTREGYDAKGNYRAPHFALHLGIHSFDHDFFEGRYVGAPPSSLADAVASNSYGAQIGPRLAEAAGGAVTDYDALVLLYEFAYDDIERSRCNSRHWRHIATVPYEK